MWDDVLADREADGRADAERGVFEPPYPGSPDPQDMDEHDAYRAGWFARRKELGDAFAWR